MSQDNKLVMIQHARVKNRITDYERIVFAYHYFEQNNPDEAKELLSKVHTLYYQSQLHKDISRALLAHATYASTQDPGLGKESEFYLIVYRLTKIITENKLHFTGSGNFYQLRDELFKGLTSEWR
jgi:hypothetical protein